MGKMPRVSGGIGWLMDMVELFQGSIVNIPSDYRSQVLAVKGVLDNDETGIISSLLDFGISSSADVDFSVEVQNENLGLILNDWLSDVNGSLLGKIPIGIEALAKEYYRERWKGSSMLLLRTVWGKVDGMILPTKMWFVDGEDIDVSSDSKVVTLGDQKYGIITNYQEKKILKLPAQKNEKIFVQKPYCSWGTDYPTPFLIQRGLYKNAVMMKNLIGKGEVVVAKALEYLMVVKKGTEALAKENRSEFIYSDEDLKAVKKQLGLLTDERMNNKGTPSYITNFDTDIEHLIPEYERILKASLFVPIERRILSGIGLVDIVESTSSSRREGTLNPKPYIGELNSGVKDFAALIKDLFLTIIIENKISHPKYFSAKKTLNVRHTPVKAFMTDDYKTMLRSLYDRGVLSKQTFVEVVGETSYSEEKDRRSQEATKGDNKIFYPPVIQNMEQHPNDLNGKPNKEVDEKEVTPDKKGPEAKNYTNANELPSDVKDFMSATLQNIWLGVFNGASQEGTEYASNFAWEVISKLAKKNDKGKWIKKKDKTSINDLVVSAVNEVEIPETTLDDVYKMKKIEFLEKKQELLNKLFNKEDK